MAEGQIREEAWCCVRVEEAGCESDRQQGDVSGEGDGAAVVQREGFVVSLLRNGKQVGDYLAVG